jgi:hypothetical protein
VTVPADKAHEVLFKTHAVGVPCVRIGTTGGAAIRLGDEGEVNVADLVRRFESWLPDYMAGKS